MQETVVYQRPKSWVDGVSSHYCPGCTHGIIHRLLCEIIDELDLQDKMVGVAPVGCAALMYGYIDIDFVESPHGRAPAVATGIKRVRPELCVLAYQGDGDLASIGCAEIVHAANRSENISVIFVNNAIYGMTGGQMAPTTLLGQKNHRLPAVVAAHVGLRLQAGAHGRAVWVAENQAALVSPQLHTTHASRFALRHAGDGAGNGRGGATGAAAGAAIHESVELVI